MTNTGTVATYGVLSDGIEIQIGRLYNSGSISSASSHAINAYAGADIHLQTGTRILHGDVHATSASNLFLDGTGSVDFNITGVWTNLNKEQEGTWTIRDGFAVSATNLNINGGTLALADGAGINVTTLNLNAGGTLAVVLGSAPAVTSTNANLFGTLAVDSVLGSGPVLQATAFAGTPTLTSLNPHFSLTPSYVGNQLIVTSEYAPQWDDSALSMTSTLHSARSFLGTASTRALRMVGTENSGLAESEEILVASNGPLSGLFSRRPEPDGFGVFLQPVLSMSNRDAAGGSPGYDSTMAGLELGADTYVTENLLLGLMAGFGTAGIGFDGVDFVESDDESQTIYTLGAYGGYRAGNWRFTDSLSLSYADHDSRRYAGLSEYAKAEYDSWLLSNSLAAHYVIAAGDGWSLIPKAGLDATYLYRGAFSEHDATNAVSYADYDDVFCESVLGLRVSKDFTADDVSFSPYAGLGWRHALGGNDMTVRQQLATTAVDVTQKNDDDFLTMETGLVLARDRFKVELAYTGEMSDNTDSHVLSANFRIDF